MTGDQAVPDLKRKVLKSYLAYAEGAPAAPPRHILDRRQALRTLGYRARSRASLSSTRATRLGDRRLVRQRMGNHRARAHPALEVTFGKQLCIRFQDRNAGNSQLRSQHARRRHSLSAMQAAVNDGFTIAVVNLLIKCGRSVAIYRDDRKDSRRYFLHFP